jgi:molybdopterin molybdotransferase
MLDEIEARRRLIEATPPGKIIRLPLIEALGATAACTLRAGVPLPGFDNSQMDGYAVRSGDAVAGAVLRVVGTQFAGLDTGQSPVQPGTAVRVFTGAPLPSGADAVVMQEDVEVAGAEIRLRVDAAPGEFVRRRGADLCEGQIILREGDRLTPARLGLLASQGHAEVPVRIAPRAVVVTTGDELVEPGAGAVLLPGQIFNSNGAMLAAGLQRFGVTRVKVAHAPDDPVRLRAVLQEALGAGDFCLIAGGVSVGERDHVKTVLSALGASGGFWKVRVKPGKPFFFAGLEDKVIFGLPGNPVSSWITFLLFVVSSLQRHAGRWPDPSVPGLAGVRAVLGEALHNDGDRPHYVRGVWNGTAGTFRSVGIQQSHALHGLSLANALVRVESGERLETGAEVTVRLMQEDGWE